MVGEDKKEKKKKKHLSACWLYDVWQIAPQVKPQKMSGGDDSLNLRFTTLPWAFTEYLLDTKFDNTEESKNQQDNTHLIHDQSKTKAL